MNISDQLFNDIFVALTYGNQISELNKSALAVRMRQEEEKERNLPIEVSPSEAEKLRTLTKNDMEKIGNAVAKEFHLKKDPSEPGRYLGANGNKTPLGVARTVLSIFARKGEY